MFLVISIIMAHAHVTLLFCNGFLCGSVFGVGLRRPRRDREVPNATPCSESFRLHGHSEVDDAPKHHFPLH